MKIILKVIIKRYTSSVWICCACSETKDKGMATEYDEDTVAGTLWQVRSKVPANTSSEVRLRDVGLSKHASIIFMLSDKTHAPSWVSTPRKPGASEMVP